MLSIVNARMTAGDASSTGGTPKIGPIRWMMRLVVEFGTAKRAASPGYVVGGKTGTSDKNSGGRYQNKKLMSSFVGVFPMHDPRYAILTLVDEPHGTKKSHGYATAGWTAAPVVREVVLKAAPLLGVLPAENTSEAPDEKAPKAAPKPAKSPAKPAARPAARPGIRTERAASE